MTTYTPIGSNGALVIENNDRVFKLIVRDADEEMRVYLTKDMLRDLGYGCALRYYQLTGERVLTPYPEPEGGDEPTGEEDPLALPEDDPLAL